MDTIIYIGGFRLPDGNAAAPRVLNNAKILRELGYKVVFIDVNDNANKKIKETHFLVDGFDCYSVKYPKGKEWGKYLTSISEFKDVYNEYENVTHVIAYNYQAFAFYKLMKFCKMRKIKLISDCTEWHGNSDFIRDLDTNFRMKYIHKRIDGVIAISRYLYDYYKGFVNTVEIPPLTDCEDDCWQKEEKSNSKLIFSYVGSPARRKDKLDAFVKAMGKIDSPVEYALKIVGATKEKYLANYPEDEELLNKLGDKLEFCGRVSKKDAMDILKASDFSIFFRADTIITRAGFPTKYAEAVTMGIPVIANLTSNLSDYIKDGENGFVIEGFDEENVRLTLNRVLNLSKEELLKVKNNCKEERNIFDYKNYIEKMKKIL